MRILCEDSTGNYSIQEAKNFKQAALQHAHFYIMDEFPENKKAISVKVLRIPRYMPCSRITKKEFESYEEFKRQEDNEPR